MMFLAGLGSNDDVARFLPNNRIPTPAWPDVQVQRAIDTMRRPAARVVNSMRFAPVADRRRMFRAAVDEYAPGQADRVEKRVVGLVHLGFPVTASFTQALAEVMAGYVPSPGCPDPAGCGMAGLGAWYDFDVDAIIDGAYDAVKEGYEAFIGDEASLSNALDYIYNKTAGLTCGQLAQVVNGGMRKLGADGGGANARASQAYEACAGGAQWAKRKLTGAAVSADPRLIPRAIPGMTPEQIAKFKSLARANHERIWAEYDASRQSTGSILEEIRREVSGGRAAATAGKGGGLGWLLLLGGGAGLLYMMTRKKRRRRRR